MRSVGFLFRPGVVGAVAKISKTSGPRNTYKVICFALAADL